MRSYDFNRHDRLSRALFSWEARDRWIETASGKLVARTGQLITLVRTTVGTRLDDQSRVVHAVHSAPRWQMDDDATNGVLDSLGLLIEPARTNVVLRNRDLTLSAWTKTNCTAVKDQVGADGLLSSASKLTATAANATCLQAITLASSQRLQSAWICRLTGSGTIQMTTDGGTTWVTVSGITTIWKRFSIPAQTVTNPNVGFRIVTSGDAIAVDFVQNENSATATSAIPTTTAAVTRNQDDASTTVAWASALLDQITLCGRIHRASWMDASGDIGWSPYICQLGNGNSRIEVYAKQTTRTLAVKLTDTAGGNQEATQAIPAGNVVTWSAQIRNLLSGTQVALDVGGGLSSFSTAVAAMTALSTDDLVLGDSKHSPGKGLAAALVSLKALPGLHTWALAPGYY